MMRAFLLTLLLIQAVSGQEKLQVDLYALPPRIHSRLDLALFARSESFLATLKKIEGSSAVEKPVSFSEEIGWGAKNAASKTEEVRYFVSYDTDSEKLKGVDRAILKVGYEADWTLLKTVPLAPILPREGKDGAAYVFARITSM